MSFCYAEINDEITPVNVSVYTDTKIGFDNYSGGKLFDSKAAVAAVCLTFDEDCVVVRQRGSANHIV